MKVAIPGWATTVQCLATAAILAVTLMIAVKPRPGPRAGGMETPLWASAQPTADPAPVFLRTLRQSHPDGGPELQGVFGVEIAPQSRTPALGVFPELRPPQDLHATATADGVLLQWLPHPRNPVGGLRYRLVRWNPDGRPEATTRVDGLEWTDHPSCEGRPYHYRVYAEIERTGADGRKVHRASPAASTEVILPLRSQWELREIDAEGRLVLVLNDGHGGRGGPWKARPGDRIGTSGWLLESFRKGETELPEVTRIPRFDGLGRRIVRDGQPAFRSRQTTVQRTFATVHFLDPCGNPRRQDLLLPLAPAAAQVGDGR